MRWTEVSCNSQLYSEHQTVYTLKVTKVHVSKVLMGSGRIQSQVQATCGEKIHFFHSGLIWIVKYLIE